MEQQTMTGSGLYIRKHPFLPASAAVALCFGLLACPHSARVQGAATTTKRRWEA